MKKTLTQIKTSLKKVKNMTMFRSKPKKYRLELTAEELLILKNVHVDYINDGDMEQLCYGKEKINVYDGISRKIIAKIKQAGL